MSVLALRGPGPCCGHTTGFARTDDGVGGRTAFPAASVAWERPALSRADPRWDVPTAASRTLVVLLLAAAAVTVGACGGEDGAGSTSTTTTTTAVERAAWSEELEQDCDALNQDYDQLVAADPGNQDEAVAYARDVERFATELVQVLDDAGVPTEDRARAEQLADLVDQLAVAAGDLADAAGAGDAGAADAAAAALESAGAAINPVADALDAPSCGGF